jgi:hypothetical protein
MNDEKRFSASTPTAHESANSTPPEKQIPFLPLTPPATNEWQSPFNPQSPASAALELIEQLHCNQSTGQPRKLKVIPWEYKKVLARLEELPDLKSFWDNKLRYAV